MIINELKFLSDTIEENKLVVLLERMAKSLDRDTPFVFISHKHNEEKYVFRLKSLLEQYGYQGYVDWEDDEMPKKTSGETASKIKRKITKSHKFILLATNAAVDSKWCNWELGFADAHKYINAIAVFPLREARNNYIGEEYLQIYPSIQTESNEYIGLNYYVRYPDGRRVDFLDWLKS